MSIFTNTTRRYRVAISGLAMTLAIAATSVVTGQDVKPEEVKPVSPDLTPKLRDLLRQEMLSVDDASKQILSALIAGEDARVAELAQQIHDSFILAQSMTAEDKQDLMAAVPEDFVTRDRAFHEISHELAEAGRAGDRAGQHEKFGRMINACSACHTLYATDRFPSLAE